MYDHGIFLNDLNKFDSSTEMIVRDLLDDLIIKKTQGVTTKELDSTLITFMSLLY